MKDEVVYLTINNWFDHGEKVNVFLEHVLTCKDDFISYNWEIWDMSIQCWFTTTMSWIKENDLDELLKFRCEKSEYHPEYEEGKINVKWLH